MRDGTLVISDNTSNSSENDSWKKFIQKEKAFSPDEVREILNTDNKEIIRLCKAGRISPKKDKTTGKTFFLRNDIEVLKEIKELHDKGERIIQSKQSTNLVRSPRNGNQSSLNYSVVDMQALISTVIDVKENVIERISTLIDDKLEGIDEVIIELINSKAENERLKDKINQLTKENYQLITNLDCYKHLAMGLYVKTENKSL